ncbi:hypothetical protein OG689_37315 [Kitasatospora sp. NBC_00240]|uniref:hypothetical protein n=1 Tax=Kitasatospora sp. NBC_00240 TaxID=2903567 RepID=UPI0022585459|nr:hypothetical protein [Kitasatospora sp. NBC_00240]MCX5214856.1 hypothetical protein [Kitasatospora sp. NBC_00240]
MSRPPTAEEQKVLVVLSQQVHGVTAGCTRQELALTGVLAGSTDPADYGLFHARFQQIGLDLLELVKQGVRLVVNENMPDGMGANTRTTWGMKPDLLDIELAPSLLASSSPRVLPPNIVTLIHELSHALHEAPSFPVKDYAYRSGWALEYLPAAMAECNADTYAEAAALLAEGLLDRPGQLRAPGRTPAIRRELLRTAGRSALGPALAWADLTVNRAWLRSNDYRVTAEMDAADTPARAVQLADWLADEDLAARVEIEGELERAGLIKPRYQGMFNSGFGLSGADKATAGQIHTFLTAVKKALTDLVPVPVADGTTVVYQHASGQLSIPHAVTDQGPVPLAALVIDAVIQGLGEPAGSETPAFTSARKRLVDLLVRHDRPVERAALKELRKTFETAGYRVPTRSEWRGLAVDLRIARLDDVVALWRVVTVQARDLVTRSKSDAARAKDASLPPASAPAVKAQAAQSLADLKVLSGLDKNLALEIKLAATITEQLAAEQIVPVAQIAELEEILAQLTVLVCGVHPEKTAVYQGLWTLMPKRG